LRTEHRLPVGVRLGCADQWPARVFAVLLSKRTHFGPVGSLGLHNRTVKLLALSAMLSELVHRCTGYGRNLSGLPGCHT
jgi:hypothetical protein